MTNMPKRQKTLLGYFTLSESGKKDRCQDGQVCKAQAQDSLTGAVKAGPGTTHPSTQRAATSDREALTDSMGNESALAQLDNQDGMMTVKSQQIIGPFSQLESDTGQHSSMGCRVSEGNAAADCTECSTASDNETDEANQYEQQRQEHIRRNNERMRSLGLHILAQTTSRAVITNEPKQKRPAKPKERLLQRSYCLRNRAKPADHESQQAQSSQELPVLQEPDQSAQHAATRNYDDSSVISYVCQQVAENSSRQADAADCGPITGFDEMPGRLIDSKLARAYSMDTSGALLAAGGKNGHAAVFGIQQALAGEEGETAPLLSAKLHKSWIADVQLLPAEHFSLSSEGNAAALPSLLTASNEGSVRLWDLSKCCGGLPLELAQADDLHTGGIWSMHYRAGKIATASKDCNLVVSSLSPAGKIVALHTYSQQHAGAVKCTRWSDDHVLATCGNDMCIKVIDTRNSNGSHHIIEEAHDGCVNCVRWHPTSEHMLVSSGADPCLHLWDLRHTQQPVFTFQGHTLMSRCSQIYQAQFVAQGSAVACSGPKSTQLSLYCISTGRTISRGDIGFEPAAITMLGKTLFCATSKQISMYQGRHVGMF